MINIFLDLEETVIDDWFSGVLLEDNISKIKNQINKFSLKFNKEKASSKNINLILFSAAITSKNDVLFFDENLRTILEQELDLSFNEVFLFSKENCFSLLKKINVFPDDTDILLDVFKFNQKEEVFNLISKKNEINILFDDKVENKVILEDVDVDVFDFNSSQAIKILVKI